MKGDQISIFVVAPLVAWVVSGSTKFLVNSVKGKQLAFGQIGYGSFPSTHSAIVSSFPALLLFEGQLDTPVFGLAVTVAIIVILDAINLRRQIGLHAAAINTLQGVEPGNSTLRLRMGHSKFEVLGGLAVGLATGFFLSFF